jgi:hypothetical protein
MKTHLVLDVVFDYSPVFAGTAEECEEWKAEQGFGYIVVPMTEEELKIHNPK